MELANRDQLEASFAARFARLNSRLRAELQRHLGYPPNFANVPEAFWREVQDEINRELAIVLLLLWQQSAVQHGLATDLAEAQALKYATDRAAELSRSYAENTREMAGAAARRWAADIPRSTLADDLGKVLGPNRAARMATTETTKAQTAGGEAGVGQTVGLSGEDQWITRADSLVCPVCKPLHKQPRAVWQQQFPTGPGDDVHPQCRCFIRYVLVAGAI